MNNLQIVNVSGACFDNVPVYSHGIWNVKHGESILQHSLVRFHLEVLLMFALASFFDYFLKRMNFPRLTSEILAGIVLGPTVLGKVSGDASKLLFPTAAPNQILASLSKMAYISVEFLTGVRMDPSLAKKTGRKAFALGILMFVIPYTIQLTVEGKFNKNTSASDGTIFAEVRFAKIFVGEMAATQFVAVTFILMHLKITNSRLGHLALASALVNELTKCLYSTLTAYFVVKQVASVPVAVQTQFISVCLFLTITVALRMVVYHFIKSTPESEPVKEFYASIVVATTFLLSSIGDAGGSNFLIAPFIFGLVVPAGSPMAKILIAKFEAIVTGFLSPIMITFCSSKIDLWQFLKEFNEVLNVKSAIIALLIKVAATFIFAISCKLALREAAALAIILNAKGIPEVGLLLSYGSLERTDGAGGICLVFLLSAFQSNLVKRLYNPAKQYIGYHKKCVQHTRNDAELQILVCAHRQEDAAAAIKLLEYSNPTTQSPVSVYGLCLEELVGSATPLLINHQLGQKSSSSSGSRSQPIIDIYNYFNTNNKNVTQMNVYIAMSPLKQMHEDICWLSFDKSCSLIIIPFHKKWNTKGNMVSGNPEWRDLNISVLDRAPCSVGILIDRSRNRGLSSIFATTTIYRVLVLFVGGPDDREAVCYALRMAGSSRVHLTVTRFIRARDHVNDLWEKMLDDEILRTMKLEMSRSTNIHYNEEAVRDGAETAAVVHSSVRSYDLIMVGRRHETENQAESGLSQWVELPELGALGDLLASADIASAASVLVVQQQIIKASHSSILN